MWLSLVEHRVRDAGVVGSNPITPTIFLLNLEVTEATPTGGLLCFCAYVSHMTQAHLPNPSDVISFWIKAGPEKWFAKDDSFDREFKSSFLDAHYAAARRELDFWMDTADGALALLILLDQLPRNCFRNTGHMFATDPLALHFTRQAISRNYQHDVDSELLPFVLMPLMHSEILQDQNDLIDLLDENTHKNTYDYAVIHRDVIARFGRFPHRNAALGRDTTADESAFLKEGGFSG